jgi:lysylphosphatidylglycerol synthetase-like protein (DUF2156 family)
MAEFDDKDSKALELALGHYTSLFIYHAGQRMGTLNFFLTAASISAGAYGFLIFRGESHFHGTAALLAGVTWVLALAFGRLDRRNAQLVTLDEEPLVAIQAAFTARFGGTSWNAFERSSKEAHRMMTFGQLMPSIYLMVALLSLGGAFYALRLSHDPAFGARIPALLVLLFFALALASWAILFRDGPRLERADAPLPAAQLPPKPEISIGEAPPSASISGSGTP